MFRTFTTREVFNIELNKDAINIPMVGEFEPVSKNMYDRIENQLQHPQQISLFRYDKLMLPTYGTKGSAGADFRIPYELILYPGDSFVVHTCMRVKILPGWLLGIFPKSGLGFKYNVQLANTTGIVDCDYYYSKTDGNDNEGHIMIKLTRPYNPSDRTPMILKQGDKFAQGIFLPYGVAKNYFDSDLPDRNGGIGSTGK